MMASFSQFMRKHGLTILVSFLLFSWALPLISAASFADGFNSFAKFTFGAVTPDLRFSEGEILFVKFMVFILLLAIINTAVKRIPQLGDNKGLSLIISIIVAVLGVRYITTSEFINFIWLPYGVLGIVLSSLLPFIIAFFFFESFDSAIIRKVGWSAFFVIFAGLAYLRWDDLATALGLGAEWYYNLALLYALIALVSLLLILFDNRIRLILLMSSLTKVTDRQKAIDAIDLKRDIRELHAKKKDANEHEMKHINEAIKDKEKKLREIYKG